MYALIRTNEHFLPDLLIFLPFAMRGKNRHLNTQTQKSLQLIDSTKVVSYMEPQCLGLSLQRSHIYPNFWCVFQWYYLLSVLLSLSLLLSFLKPLLVSLSPLVSTLSQCWCLSSWNIHPLLQKCQIAAKMTHSGLD